MEFNKAQDAFIYLYDFINRYGIQGVDTKYVENIGFYILNPLDRLIDVKGRNWKLDYAEKEWEWYLSGNPYVTEIKKIAKIWDRMHNGDDLVNSNYGYQWSRGNQLEYVINELKNNESSRRAVISIYDGKENTKYSKDTPCTLAIYFSIYEDKLNMSVVMRSNDLWYGFCNDQYCFSKLQEYIALKLDKKVGKYHHFVNNLHIYNNFLNKVIYDD